MSKTIHPTRSETTGARERLLELRQALLQLHKTLIDSERRTYEHAFGRIVSPYHFLHLLTSDPWFAWLSPVTQLLAVMDERLEDAEPLTVAGVADFSQRMKSLLVPSENGEGFSKHYDEALQRSPDVLFAHVTLSKLLREQNGR
jgi:hypothetical protein